MLPSKFQKDCLEENNDDLGIYLAEKFMVLHKYNPTLLISTFKKSSNEVK